jgi:hypothetical protein
MTNRYFEISGATGAAAEFILRITYLHGVVNEKGGLHAGA